jgi:hypothetical protein
MPAGDCDVVALDGVVFRLGGTSFGASAQADKNREADRTTIAGRQLHSAVINFIESSLR